MLIVPEPVCPYYLSLKGILKPTLLQYPDFSKEFCITTDESKHTCGAVLSQDCDGA